MKGPLPVGGTGAFGPGRTELILVGLSGALVCGLACLWMGRDLNWDYFNYHAYSALLLQQDRLSQDFFAAGYQGYLNPLAFLPSALMLRAGWHSALVGVGLAALHSLNVLFLYLVCRRFVSDTPRPVLSAILLTALGCVAGVFVGQIGSSFYDVTTTPLIMAALWMLITRPGQESAAIAGALAGAAIALKWTNAPYGLGVLVACVFGRTVTSLRERGTIFAKSVIFMMGGFLLLYAAWGWKLWTHFHSPVFPLFNGVFHAPDFPAQGFSFDRFVPRTWGVLAAMPWRMMSLEGWIYTESAAPDLRPMLLLGLLALAIPLVIWREGLPGMRFRSNDVRPLILFFGGALPAWVLTSSNGRYAVPLVLLLSPLIYLTAHRIAGQRRALMLVLLALILQSFHAWSAGNPRWNPQPWTHDWLPATLPSGLQQAPNLYVLVGRSSESYLAAYTHPDSAFTNPIGLLSIANNAPGWSRFIAMREAWAGRTQVVFRVPANATPELMAEVLKVHNEMIDRLGLEFSVAPCERAIFNSDSASWRLPGSVESTDSERRAQTRHLAICPVRPKRQGSVRLREGREQAARAMDLLERMCPAVFQPHGVQVEGNEQLWSRSYGRHDLFVLINPADGNVLLRQEHQAIPVLVGRLGTWQADVARFDCRLPHDGVRGVSTLKGFYANP